MGADEYWDVPGGDTIFCILDHIDIGDSFSPDDWTAGDIGDPQTLASNIGIISTTPDTGFKSIDISPFIQADIHSGKANSSYRIRFPIGTENHMICRQNVV